MINYLSFDIGNVAHINNSNNAILNLLVTIDESTRYRIKNERLNLEENLNWKKTNENILRTLRMISPIVIVCYCVFLAFQNDVRKTKSDMTR